MTEYSETYGDPCPGCRGSGYRHQVLTLAQVRALLLDAKPEEQVSLCHPDSEYHRRERIRKAVFDYGRLRKWTQQQIEAELVNRGIEP